jgi:hypothetical protein
MTEGVLNTMAATLEWPGRCRTCKQQIEDWADAGTNERGWVHKSCYSNETIDATKRGIELPPLKSPVDRARSLEWPMMVSILMFHFGIGVGFIGWIMLTQNHSSNNYNTLGYILLITGIITPLTGIVGVAINVLGRRRIELVRRALDLSGGWKPL